MLQQDKRKIIVHYFNYLHVITKASFFFTQISNIEAGAMRTLTTLFSLYHRLPRKKPPHDRASELFAEQSDDGQAGAVTAGDTGKGESVEDRGELQRQLLAQR